MGRFRRVLYFVPFAVIGVLTAGLLASFLANHAPRLSVDGLGASVLSEGGPIAGGAAYGDNNRVYVMAATSLPDLCGLALALGDARSVAGGLDPCWGVSKPPADSLFVAILAMVPCASTHLTLSLDKAGLNISAQSSGSCPAGSGTLASPTLSLIAVPLRNLPSGALLIDPAGATTLVDLRPPFQQQDALTRFREARLAIEEAETDVQAPAHLPGTFNRVVMHPVDMTELSLMSWNDPGLGCLPGVAPDGLRRWGYEMTIRGEQYRWTPGVLVLCGPGRLGPHPGVRPVVDPDLLSYLDTIGADQEPLMAAWTDAADMLRAGAVTTPDPTALDSAAQRYVDDLSATQVPAAIAQLDQQLRGALHALVGDLDGIALQPSPAAVSQVWSFDSSSRDYVEGPDYAAVLKAAGAVREAMVLAG